MGFRLGSTPFRPCFWTFFFFFLQRLENTDGRMGAEPSEFWKKKPKWQRVVSPLYFLTAHNYSKNVSWALVRTFMKSWIRSLLFGSSWAFLSVGLLWGGLVGFDRSPMFRKRFSVCVRGLQPLELPCSSRNFLFINDKHFWVDIWLVWVCVLNLHSYYTVLSGYLENLGVWV